MTNKDQLQKELKEKVKLGIKPSDLKKKPTNVKPNEDEGYLSEEEEKNVKTVKTKQIKELEQKVQYWSNIAQTHLKNLQKAMAQITNLEEQVKELMRIKPNSELLVEKNKQIEIIAKENEKNQEKAHKATKLLNKQSESVRKAQVLIKEQAKNIKELEAKNQEQYKTIEDLKNKQKNTIKDKGEIKETKIFLGKQKTSSSFFCDNCQLTKTGEYIKRKVDCPFEPRLHGRVVYLCSSCSPYVKELSETNFDKDNNPYKLF